MSSKSSITVPRATKLSSTRPQRVQREWLPGGRLHLNDGPIDLIIHAEGDPNLVDEAYRRASSRFETILDELVAELPLLRAPFTRGGPAFVGPVARRMASSVAPHQEHDVTAMIAVAGSVADEVLSTMIADDSPSRDPGKRGTLERVYVNNGGDIALELNGDAQFTIGIASQPNLDSVPKGARIRIRAKDGIGGIATSGLGGRSLTLGIADAVTVLARSAAEADVASTLIANAVDVDDSRIERIAAVELDPDSDLGDRLVTLSRGSLSEEKICQSLDRGVTLSEEMIRRGQIRAVLLQCAGLSRVVGHCATLREDSAEQESFNVSSEARPKHQSPRAQEMETAPMHGQP